MEVKLLNVQRLRDALQDYSTISRKSMGQAINNALGDIALTAIRTTYKSNASKIEADLARVVDRGPSYIYKTGIKYGGKRGAKPEQLFSKSGKAKTFKRAIKTGLRSKGLEAPYRLANWILKNQGLAPLGKTKIGIAGQGFGKSSGEQGTIGRHARNLIAARKRSVQFLGIGWAAAAKLFGKRPRKGDFGDKTIERIGGGVKAQEDRAITEGVIFNNTGKNDIRYFPVRRRVPSGISKIGMPGLLQAMNEVLSDPKRGIIPYIKARLDRLPLGRRGLYG